MNQLHAHSKTTQIAQSYADSYSKFILSKTPIENSLKCAGTNKQLTPNENSMSSKILAAMEERPKVISGKNYEQSQEINNKCKSKENIKPIATDMPKESLHNPIDKQFFNSPTSKQFNFSTTWFQSSQKSQKQKNSDDYNHNIPSKFTKIPYREKKSSTNLLKKGQQIKLDCNQNDYTKFTSNEQQFAQPPPGTVNSPIIKKMPVSPNEIGSSPKFQHRPKSTNTHKNKNVATISLDTSDFIKLKRRMNNKESVKALSRNHSNEKTLKQSDSNLNKPVAGQKKFSKLQGQSNNESLQTIILEKERIPSSYNLNAQKNINYSKQQLDNACKQKDETPAQQKKTKRQLTQHDFKNLVIKDQISIDKQKVTNVTNAEMTRKSSINTKKSNFKDFHINSSNKKNDYQLILQANVSSVKHQYKFSRNNNLKINNFVNNENQSQKLSVKTMSHKTLAQKNSKNMLNDQVKTSNVKTKAFNFQKYDKDKLEESKNNENVNVEEQQQKTTKQYGQPKEYEKLQQKLNYLESKILSIKTNMAANQNTVIQEDIPKSATAENSQAFTFLNKQTEKVNTPQIAVRSSYDNVQFIKNANNDINHTPSGQPESQKKRELSKNIVKPEIKKPQELSEQQQKSKNINNGTQARHVRNYTSDLNSKQNATQKVQFIFYIIINQHEKQQEEVKPQQSNLQSLVTQVKFGQGFPSSKAKEVVTEAIPQQITPIIQQSDVMLFQELYYIPKILESFMINIEDYFVQLFREHMMQTLQTVHFTNFLKPVNPQILQSKSITLERKVDKKKTIIFDLDETLIHCNESLDIQSDIILPIQFPTGEQIQAGVNIRPYTRECLQTLSQYYELIVFTASHSCYANVVLDYLDPENKFISHRLFRDNCIQTEEGIYVKDLRIFKNRNLEDLLIVDNAAYSFAFHLNNGIPIVPYYENQEDTELKDLTNYLVSLANCNNFVEINANVFKLTEYSKFNNPIELLSTLYSNFLENE